MCGKSLDYSIPASLESADALPKLLVLLVFLGLSVVQRCDGSTASKGLILRFQFGDFAFEIR